MPQFDDIHTTLVSTDIARSKKFYSEALGLEFTGEQDGGLNYRVGGHEIYIYPRETPPKADHTLLTLGVQDVTATLKELQTKGINAQKYPGFEQDDLGVAVEPNSGRKGAWITDPDGNILAVFEKA